jgi:hypothetical protein
MFYLIAGVLLIFILLTSYLVSKKDKDTKEGVGTGVADGCCGAHSVCESETLMNSSTTIVYYEDEELDAYLGVTKNSFTDDQIEEFREVLYSLKEEEVSGWLKSLQLRNVTIPDIIKEEALMIVAERRYQNETV